MNQVTFNKHVHSQCIPARNFMATLNLMFREMKIFGLKIVLVKDVPSDVFLRKAKCD